MYGYYLFVAFILLSLLGALGAAVLNSSPRAARIVSFTCAALAGLAGMACAVDVLLNGGFILTLFDSRFGTFSFAVDGLSAFFLLMVSLISLVVAVYSIGYAREYENRYSLGLMGFLYNMFVLSMALVVAAYNAVLFLMAWEAMSLLSYALVVYENRNPDAARAGFIYIVMTHAGAALITLGFLLLAAQTGSFDFSSFTGAGATMPGLFKGAVFLLLLAGFGTKAGLIPLHVWLPYAHPEAPSNISALMSGVMVKTAIYMLIRCIFEFLGVTDTWWGLLVLLVASISAVLGVLYALGEHDLKRLLAYHTIENVGIIMIALGASMAFMSYRLTSFAALALIAALIHVLNHAIFKSLLFMGAGSVLFATHTKDIEKLGGLVKRMPWTSAFFLVGALAISAIPPLNGFVSEWLIFQSLLLSFNFPEMIVKISIPIAIGMLALTGALAAACFVKAYGITFLARPRSARAAEAREVPPTMLAGMAILALLCILTGLFSIVIVPAIDGVTTPIIGVSVASQMVDGIVMKPVSNSFSGMSPLAISILIAIALPAIYVITRYYGGRQKIVYGDTWDCGTPLTARNEYTGTGYAKSINMIFSAIYRPGRELATQPTSSPHVKKEMPYSGHNEQLFEKYLYNPVGSLTVRAARRLSFIQMGSIQAYLTYIFITLVLLLILFR